MFYDTQLECRKILVYSFENDGMKSALTFGLLHQIL